MCHASVGVERRGTGQDGSVIVVFAKTEVESACALKVGCLKGAMERPRAVVKGFHRLGTSSRRVSDERSLGRQQNK